jgi:O-antigen ligase
VVLKIKIKRFFTRSNSFEWTLILVLFSLPTGVKIMINLALLALVVNSLLLLKKQHWRSALFSPIFWAPALFFLVHVLSLLYTQNIEQGLKGLQTKLSFILAPLLILAAAPRYQKQASSKFMIAFLGGLLLACLWALGNAALLAWQQGAWFYDLQDGFGRRYYFTYTHLAKPIMHPGYFSTYLGFGIFGLFWLWPKTQRKGILVLTLFLFFGMLVLLQGRINLVAFFTVFGFMALLRVFQNYARAWLVVLAVPFVLLGLIIWGASPDFKERYLQMPDFDYAISGTEFNSATYRLAEWHCAVKAIQKKPFLGYGFGDHKEALMKAYAQEKFWEGLRLKFNAHNQFLETTLALGVLGLIFLLVLIGLYARLAWQQKNLVVLGSLGYFTLCMLTESMFARAWAVLLFNAFFPLFLVLGKQEKLATPPGLNGD